VVWWPASRASRDRHHAEGTATPHRSEGEAEEQLYDVLDLSLEPPGTKGDPGPKGDQGDKGDKGDPGDVAGLLAGEVTGPPAATVVSAAVSDNIGNAIVRRDGSGSFAAGSIGLTGNLDLPITSSVSAGVITKGGQPFLHDSGSAGTANTFVGSSAGNLAGSTGVSNTGVGTDALGVNTTGSENSAFGHAALWVNTTGRQNSAFGWCALCTNSTGGANAAFGLGALYSNTTGSANAAFGEFALFSNRTAELNSAFGWFALVSLTSGDHNSAFGSRAFEALGNGSFNIGVGDGAGGNLVSGNNNIYIGNAGSAAESDTIRIGSSQTSTYIAGISGQTSAGGVAVFVDADGKLGTITSSRRYKEDIASMGLESDVLMSLRPVAFYYRPEYDAKRTRQYGLVAEEVAEVAPQLVAFDDEGDPETVRYHFVSAMLLNEVKKQRRLVEQQQFRIEELEARLARIDGGYAEIATVAIQARRWPTGKARPGTAEDSNRSGPASVVTVR